MNTLVSKRTGPEFLQFIPEKQYLFIKEFPDDFNGKQAAIRAGYAESSAARTACDLLKKAVIQKGLAYYAKRGLAKAELTADEAISQLKMAVTRRVGDLQDEYGNYLQPRNLPEHMQSIVDEVKVRLYYNKETGEQEQEVRYRLTPHAAAREQTLKYCNLLVHEDVQGEKLVRQDWDHTLGGPGSSSGKIEDEIEGKE